MDIYGYKILAVDDNEEILHMIRAILTEEGYREVCLARSVKEGMDGGVQGGAAPYGAA